MPNNPILTKTFVELEGNLLSLIYKHLDSEKWLAHIIGIVSILIGVIILSSSAKLQYVTSGEITVSRTKKESLVIAVNFRQRFIFFIKRDSYCSRPTTSLDVGMVWKR